MRRAARLGAALCWLAGCAASHMAPRPGDAGVEQDASPPVPDARVDADPAPIDAGWDAAVADAGVDAGIDAGWDAGVDAGVDAGPDAAPDAAPPCPVCVASGPCVSSECVAGACVESNLLDGTRCGDALANVCIAGVCQVPACGDGVREPSGPAREGCDDGNLVDGDGCSSTCEPEPIVIEYDPSGSPTGYPDPQGPTIAADGRGQLLVVWIEVDYVDSMQINRLVARRYSEGGVALPVAGDDPIEIDPKLPSTTLATPTVAGLSPSGWVVAWGGRSPVLGDSIDVHYRLVAPDGSLGSTAVANELTDANQATPRVASMGSRFVIAWHDEADRSTDPSGGIRARVFGAGGTPLYSAMTVPTDASGTEFSPTVAADASGFMVAWVHGPPLGGTTATRQLLYRRYDPDGAPIDLDPVEAAPDFAALPMATSLGGGTYAMAWTSTADDYMGDIVAQVISPLPAVPAAPVPIANTPSYHETLASVAALGPGSFVVSWGDGPFERAAFAASPGAALAPEASWLSMHLSGRTDGPAPVARGEDRLWFVWQGWDAGPQYEGISMYGLPLE